MCAGLTKAAEALVQWCDTHPNSYPPTVLHVTDGASTDGDPESVASALQRISTGDGECLLFNIHVSTQQGETVQYPSSDAALPDSYGKLLAFGFQHDLPPHVSKLCGRRGFLPLQTYGRYSQSSISCLTPIRKTSPISSISAPGLVLLPSDDSYAVHGEIRTAGAVFLAPSPCRKQRRADGKKTRISGAHPKMVWFAHRKSTARPYPSTRRPGPSYWCAGSSIIQACPWHGYNLRSPNTRDVMIEIRWPGCEQGAFHDRGSFATLLGLVQYSPDFPQCAGDRYWHDLALCLH